MILDKTKFFLLLYIKTTNILSVFVFMAQQKKYKILNYKINQHDMFKFAICKLFFDKHSICVTHTKKIHPV